METTTTFDLNRAIQQWRENLAQSPAFRSENLDELETHLRDSIGSLQTHGLSAEEALIVASKRIGRLSCLEAEFGKVNGQAVWLDRILWVLIGIQLWTLVANVSSVFYTFAHALLRKFNELLPVYGVSAVPENALSTTISLLAFPVTLVLAAVICWRMIRRWENHLQRLLLKFVL